MVRTAVFQVNVIRSQRSCDLFRVHYVTLEPIKGFRRNMAQMLTTLSRRAELNLQTAYRKVNVKGPTVIGKRASWAHIAPHSDAHVG